MSQIPKCVLEVMEHFWMEYKPMQRELETIKKTPENANKIDHLKKTIACLEEVLNVAEEDLKTIIQLRYWDLDSAYEWEEIADELDYSRSKTLRRRAVLLRKTAESLGWL